MTKKYDLVIVGAGPGGTMAAKTAGENGLKTAIIERKEDPSEITRGCAMMFAVESDYYFAERMYFNEKNNKMVFPVNGFTVDYDGPTRNFYAWHFYAPDGKTRLKFGNYDENFKKGDAGRLSLVYDKGKLLTGLMKDVQKSGVDLFTGVHVDEIEKTTKGVKVSGNGETFEGTFVIAADGINSTVADLIGFNEDRIFFGRNSGVTYYIRGVNIPQSEAVISGHGFKADNSLHSFFWIIPSPYAGDEYWFAVKRPEEFDYITKESIYSSWFPNLEVTRKRGFVTNMRSPVSDPYKDNVLLVGDSAWFWEAEITGSMMCGRKAANAITVALRDNKPDREGVSSYIEWWKKSYPEFDDYRNFFMLIPFCNIFSEKELNYLFGLFKDSLRLTLNPFLVVRLVKKALEPMRAQVQEEMPSIIKKLNMLEVENIEEFTKNIPKFFKKR